MKRQVAIKNDWGGGLHRHLARDFFVRTEHDLFNQSLED
jgi:hypothetical protein